MLSLLALTLFTLTCTVVYANTEKTIFLGPPVNNILPSSAHSTLEDLLQQVHTLVPGSNNNGQIRTHLEAQFPASSSSSSSSSYPNGKPTWLVLDGLAEGRRYEVRVCWAATQPTAFKLETYELPTVLKTPGLISELSDYALSRHSGVNDHQDDSQRGKAPHIDIDVRSEGGESSVLFLRILAAAEYYTTNKTLMSHVPPVYVDIILDPFVFNILPQSLMPTVGYIIVVAVASWFIARQISLQIRNIAAAEPSQKKDQ